MKLLLVDRSDRGRALQIALGDAGHIVSFAPSAAFALTAIEWTHPQAIVSGEDAGDMPGDELCAIVRSDPATKELPFILLAELNDTVAARAAAAGVDLLLAGEFQIASAATRITRYLGEALGELALSPADPRDTQVPGTPVPKTPVAGVAGSLAIMELPDIVQALGRNGKTGRLVISSPVGEGLLILDAGRVVHAEHEGRSGEPAFASMLAHTESGGTFAFEPVTGDEIASSPRSVDATAEGLLLSVAARIDEHRAAPPAASVLDGQSTVPAEAA